MTVDSVGDGTVPNVPNVNSLVNSSTTNPNAINNINENAFVTNINATNLGRNLSNVQGNLHGVQGI